ncbi:glycosyltransferase [uncultured Aliivibrio sp.]|uniref:glycosyltransferase family 2 protein n=1 Tax=uncultured Aliivibrio sp. TaxID=873085 RepID=UPI00261167B0|nr:glycosyltransferase [uncultured Aliivibrio sp.]
MKVSILMNGYNCQKYVKEAIDSVIAQTYENWELVFINNCSTDQTLEIVESYDNEKIKCISTSENIPLGAAREVGLKYCDGDYVCFLDTDDLWLSNKLEKQLEMFKKDIDLKMVYTGVYFINGSGKCIGKYTPSAGGDIFRRQLVRYEINQQSVMIRNDFDFSFDQNKKYSVDYCLFMSICAKYKVGVLESKLVKYRMHDSNLSHSVNELEWIEQKDTLDNVFQNNLDLEHMYPKEYQLAYARVFYYKARYLMSVNEASNARVELKKYYKTNLFYCSLYLLSLFPVSLWSFLHKKIRRFS